MHITFLNELLIYSLACTRSPPLPHPPITYPRQSINPKSPKSASRSRPRPLNPHLLHLPLLPPRNQPRRRKRRASLQSNLKLLRPQRAKRRGRRIKRPASRKMLRRMVSLLRLQRNRRRQIRVAARRNRRNPENLRFQRLSMVILLQSTLPRLLLPLLLLHPTTMRSHQQTSPPKRRRNPENPREQRWSPRLSSSQL